MRADGYKRMYFSRSRAFCWVALGLVVMGKLTPVAGCWQVFTVMVARCSSRDFLRDQNVNLTVASNISHYAGNVTSAPAKAAILMRNIGDKNNPVMAEYFRGFGQGHYSLVTKYAVYDTGSNGLNVQTLTDPSEWMSLLGTWGTERGVFTLE